ncbi:hypothetical protein PAEPH01_2190 [Pancytospora epiphaga]|nr:hypothetical protein PAEPH01_2190 [Pancytospora epiphaga]
MNNLSPDSNRDKHFVHYQKGIVKGTKQTPYKFKLGNKVFIYKKILGDTFKPCWTGGFIIIGLVFPNAYTVSNSSSTLDFNKKHVKRG